MYISSKKQLVINQELGHYGKISDRGQNKPIGRGLHMKGKTED